MTMFSKFVIFTGYVSANQITTQEIMLKQEVENAIALKHGHQLSSSANFPEFNRKEFVDVFLGIAEGMDLQLVDTCVEDSLDFYKQVETAVEAFVGKDSEGVADGLRQVGVAVGHTLPKALRVCHASYAEIADLIKAYSAFTTPESFAYHMGKDLLVNGVDIYKTMNGAIGAWKAKQYHAFGYDIGHALKDLMATKKPSVHPVEIDLSYDGTTRFRVITAQTKDTNGVIPTPADGIDFTNGLFDGFGVNIPQNCVKDDTELGKLVDSAAEAASKGTIAGVAIAMEMLARAYQNVLPEVETECGPAVSDAVHEVQDALKNFSSPYEILVQFGHNIEVNEVDIMAELAGFISDFKGGNFKDAGGYIGRALHQVVIGTDKKLNLRAKNSGFFKKVSDIFA